MASSDALGTLTPPPHEARRLPAEAVKTLADAGVYGLLVPREYGGEEAGVRRLVDVLSEVARVDGSIGWCAMIGSTSALMATYADAELARRVFVDERAITCGVFAPMGRLSREGDRARITGRWTFASGCEHATWRMVGVLDEGVPRAVLLRADETRVVDTWNTAGLRATGSHDLVVEDVVVEASRAFSFFTPPRHDAPVYRISLFGLLSIGIAAVAVGIAEGALARFIELARSKRPPGAKRSLAEREPTQLHVADAWATTFAAKAAVIAAGEAAEAEARATGATTPATRAALRLAACRATRDAASAVDLVFRAAGASAIHDASPLSRAFRDVHTATQHVMVSDAVATQAAKVHMGLDADLLTL